MRLASTIATDELVDARFGPTTRRAVLDFQRMRGLTPTGSVDAVTAEALRAALVGQPSTFYVTGRVRWNDGQPAAGLTVRVVDRDIRREQPLGEVVTDESGLYIVAYTAQQFARAEKASADVLVRVHTGDQKLHDPGLRGVLFQAPDLAVIDVNLAMSGAPALSEYECIFAAIVPLLDDVPLSGLRQDGDIQDVTFLAGETGFPAAALSHFGLAQKLAEARQIPASFFYALLAEQTLLRAGLSGAVGVRFGIDLSTELLPLFYDVARLDEATVRAAVGDAIQDRLVPPALADRLDSILAELARARPEADRYVADERPRVLFGQVQRFLAAGTQERVWAIIAEDSLGDLPRLLSRLTEAAAFPDQPAAEAAATVVMTVTELSDVLGYDQQIIERIRRHQRIDEPGEVRRLARLSPAGWRQVLRDTTADVRIAGQPLRPHLIDLHASSLARKLERRYPTTAFTAQLERDPNTLGEGHAAAVELLNAHPDFDLANGNIEALLRGRTPGVAAGQAKDLSAARAPLKAAQRIFKLAPTYRQTRALLGAGVPSAAKIHAMGRIRFVAAATQTGAFSEAQARTAYQKAADQHIASALLAGQLYGAAASLHLRSLRGGAQPEQFWLPGRSWHSLQAVTEDFPNLKSLFQLGDACFCEECRSVHSAAAYLVDTLQFLSDRLVTDTTAPGSALKQAKEVLSGRRPDVGDLDLNCDNTNTPLPYIDLVCELLEEAVAPDPGFPFAGQVSAGVDPVEVPSPALLAALQAQGWPFTGAALVYEPDLKGARVVRDAHVIAKLTPDAGGGWTVRRLHQTAGTAAELAAAPQYVNTAAYGLLATSNYAFGLPYDLAHQETRSYFAQFDVSRAALMRALQVPAGPTDAAIAAEELSLSEAERQLIATPNPSKQSQIWTTGALATLGGIARVDNFLSRSRLDYRQLTELLSLGWVNPSDAMFVKHLDSGCDLSQKKIENLDDPALDRLHRFLRLWYATGWSMPLLDRAIRALKLGGGAVSDACLVRLAQLIEVHGRLGLPVDEVVNLYDPLPGDDPRWLQLFLNPSANGPVDDAFRPENVRANELAEAASPGSGVKLASHQGYLSTCLGLTPAEIALLVSDLGAGAIVSYATVTTVYASALLMRALHLSAADLLIMRELIGLDPLASPADTLEFAGRALAVTGAGIKPADLRYLLRHEADDLAARELPVAKLTGFLTELQGGYQAAYVQTRPDVDPALPPEENKPGLRLSLSKVPGVGEPDLAGFESIVDGTWADPAVLPAQFVDAKLAGVVNTASIKSAIVANPTDAQKNAMMVAITAVLAEHFYVQAKNDLVIAAVATAFALSENAAETVLTTARLTFPPALGNRLLVEVLTDDALVAVTGNPPALPAVTPVAFDAQYRALRLLHALSLLVAQLRVPDAGLGWLLARASGLGWLAPDTLPYQTGVPAVTLASWERLAAGLELIQTHPPVANPLDPATPWTATGLFDLVLAPGATGAQVHAYLAQLAGWDAAVLAALDAHLGLSTADVTAYRLPGTIERLATALMLLRRLGLGVAPALTLVQPVTTTAAAATMRQALKSRYSEAEWLGVQQTVQDRLRIGKRDALVCFLLAENPTLRSTNDLYDYFLIDVEMSTCMPTTRMVQAHATVQLFVQRCLMGLEPQSVASVTEDPSWEQWKWMANFRLWEANRKVFLWPENWILPELRDDKSELFVDLENQLQQDELTDLAVENATVTYLERLDDLAHLDVMACYYQTDIHVMHVFARTRGGDPAVYYYRQFQQERYWTPWVRVPLDIAGDHLLAFERNGRLTLAWPVFTEEAQTTATQTIPDPDIIPNDGLETEQPKKRWRIQLAVGERASGKWQPKKVSKGALLFPPDGGYLAADALPLPEDFAFVEYALGPVGQAISCLTETNFVGSFALTGCRGYPEPTQGGGDPLPVAGFQLLPRFKDAELLAERFVELKPRQGDDLVVTAVLMSPDQRIIAHTPGQFRITYPIQVALIDSLLVLLQIYLNAAQSGKVPLAENALALPLGTLMPYFYGDYERAYVIIPGWYDLKAEDPTKRTEKTYADIDQFVRAALALAFKYLKVYMLDPQHDLQKTLEALVKDQEFVRLWDEFLVYLSLTYGLRFANFYHPLVCFLRTTLNSAGIPALMSRAAQLKTTTFDFDLRYGPEPIVVPKYPVEDIDFAADGAYAGYNWELFFHLPFEIAMRLNGDQRFAEARDWFHYIFNPVGTEESGGTPAPHKFWITRPFFEMKPSDYLGQRISDIMYAIAAEPSGATITDLKFAVSQWRDKPFQPHVVARSRPVAYQLAIIVNYIKNLVDWGDQLFRQFTRESVTQATQLYILADKLLGPKPSVVPPLVTPAAETYNQLEAKLDLFGNALIDLENLIPDLNLLPHGGAELPSPLTFSSLYFCIPANDKLLGLWDLIEDRLFKIRNCQNIDGVEAMLALFSPPIDPGALVRAAAAGLDISAFLAGLGAPLPNYRFRVMTQKATELVAHVSSLGAELLSALEKRDAEKLSRLHATQEIALLDEVRAVKLAMIDEADGGIEALNLSRAVVKERQQYYDSRTFTNTWEDTAAALAGLSLLGEAGIALGYILAGGLKLIPDFIAGTAGFGGTPAVQAKTGGEQAGGAADAAVATLSSLARALDKGAAMAATQGGYHRRMDDWEHQAALAARELTQIDQQIANAQLHVTMLQEDLAAHDRQAANAKQTDAYLRSKYTNQELYEWMTGQVSSVYFSAYKLAFDVAKKAERCFEHELGTAATYLKPQYWDSLKKGLHAANALHHDIKRMEVAYLDQHRRERELTKHVSLAQLNAAALIQLRATGSCVVNVPEAAFDLDHPGHYFRRLRAVSLSIPCVAGPYTSVSAKLSLISNRYRKNTAQHQNAATAKDKYREQPGDERFAYNIGTIESIATSTGLTDSGMFEFSYSDDRYLPFEGKGAIGTWRLELPHTFRQFDYDTISDVILHVRYTARDGGSTLRTVVEASLREQLNEVLVDATHTGLYQAYSLRHQFPDQWWQLTQQHSTQLTVGLDHLPFMVRGHAPAIDAVTWYARLDSDPLQYSLSVAGAQPVTLDRKAELHQCVGPSDPITLGTPFTVAANPAGLRDLTLLVHYKLNT